MCGRLLEFFGAILDPFFLIILWRGNCIISKRVNIWILLNQNVLSIVLLPLLQLYCPFFWKRWENMEFLRSHGVLPTTVTCPHCKSLCNYRRDQKTWHCWKRISVPKSKKTTCSFNISDFKGFFCIIPIFRLGKLSHFFTPKKKAISGITGLCWNS